MAPPILRALLMSLMWPHVSQARVTSHLGRRADGDTGGGTKYLITFGDSYSQTGFNINTDKPSMANPIGNPPFPGWTASGGLNWVGFLTSEMNTSLLLTYNFAYGGATTDATLVKPYKEDVLSFIDQVGQFKSVLVSHPTYAPWTSVNSLFGIWIGVNDVGNIFWLSNATAIVDLIMDRYFAQLRVMYDAGARNFALLSVPPIDKTPAMIERGEEATSRERVVIKYYNDAIANRLAKFTAANRGVVGKVIDTHAPFNRAINNPTAYGSPDATCWNSNGNSCLWFDNYHPGVAINKLVAGAVKEAWKGAFFR